MIPSYTKNPKFVAFSKYEITILYIFAKQQQNANDDRECFEVNSEVCT